MSRNAGKLKGPELRYDIVAFYQNICYDCSRNDTVLDRIETKLFLL